MVSETASFRYDELDIEIVPGTGRDTTGDRFRFVAEDEEYEIENGLVHQPGGIETATATLGIKKSKKVDFTVVKLPHPCPAAGLFTRSLCPSVTILRARRICGGTLQALAVNSGNANVFTPTGERDLERTAELLGSELGIAPEKILINSTGVIGVPLPMECFEQGIPGIASGLKPNNLQAAAEAILTTDLGPKTASFRSGDLVICGIAKGAGMIEPNLATMLVYFFTNAKLSPGELRSELENACNASFNRMSIDSDTSTSDSVAIFATDQVALGTEDRPIFSAALRALAVKLARDIVSQGEGVSKIIEARVESELGSTFALEVAKLIINSPLVKAAVHGADPNWGRVVAAIGKARRDRPLDPKSIRIWLMGEPVYNGGEPLETDLKAVSAAMRTARRIPIEVEIGKGGSCRVFGADLTEDYVKFNSEYTS